MIHIKQIINHLANNILLSIENLHQQLVVMASPQIAILEQKAEFVHPNLLKQKKYCQNFIKLSKTKFKSKLKCSLKEQLQFGIEILCTCDLKIYKNSNLKSFYFNKKLYNLQGRLLHKVKFLMVVQINLQHGKIN